MTKPLPTTEEVLAWVDREYEMSELRDKHREDNGLSHDEDGYRASLLANRDVSVRLKAIEEECAGVDAIKTGCDVQIVTAKVMIVRELQADIAKRIDEVM